MAAQAIALLPVYEKEPPALRIAERASQRYRDALKRKCEAVRSARIYILQEEPGRLSFALGARRLI